MHAEKFTVDSALLRELGERLVGKPHVALGELIKNAYDADARLVTVRFSDDQIDIIDDGHGMTYEEFRDHWMRIGTPHKARDQISRHLGRPLTGSKGIGRLAAQFLASELSFRTVPSRRLKPQLQVSVNWEDAVNVGTLTEATALYNISAADAVRFAEDSAHGMAITLKRLCQSWGTEEITELAKEVWMLQPPFGRSALRKDKSGDSFRVVVESDDPEAVKQFEHQAKAALRNWHARILGKLTTTKANGQTKKAKVAISLDFGNDTKSEETFEVDECSIRNLEFEIRIYHLTHRQPLGISVGVARDYFNRFGGVHIYDAGFRLPYYGTREADWLELEFDHAHRLSISKLLPAYLNHPEAMNYLPTNSRVYGVINVNTSAERSIPYAVDCLKMSVTRDRLIDNLAFQQLKSIVRWSIDYYATQEAKRSFQQIEALRPKESTSAKLLRVEDVLEKHAHEMPKTLFATLSREIADAIEAGKTEEEFREKQIGLLGALATAGMTALAFEHELNREIQSLRNGFVITSRS